LTNNEVVVIRTVARSLVKVEKFEYLAKQRRVEDVVVQTAIREVRLRAFREGFASARGSIALEIV
jgi:hypothetical protein